MRAFVIPWIRRKRPVDDLALGVAAPATPVIRYVNLLLLTMHKENSLTRELHASTGLPPLEIDGERLAPGQFDKVINRLKILCRLDPVTYPAPTEGTTSIGIYGRDYALVCLFDDQSDRRCVIHLQQR